jgi:hypothetical protein
VLAARAHGAEGRWDAVEALDEALAAIDRRHPLFEAARGFRVDWRVASGDVVQAREALTLLDEVLAIWPETPTLARRAEAAAAAGDGAAVLATARELSGRPDASVADLERARNVLQGLAVTEQVAAARRALLLGVLQQRLAAASPPGAP